MFVMWLEINISIFINMLSDLRLNFQLESDPSLHFIYVSHFKTCMRLLVAACCEDAKIVISDQSSR